MSEFKHFIKFLAGLENPQTQTTENERKTIEKYARNKETALEIGVFEGVNTNLIARALSSGGKLYGIDPFFRGRLGISYPYLITKITLRRNKLITKVALIQDFSYNVANEIPENIDFIFIDGDHSIEGITKDWNFYTPKLKIGGIIALHDTTVPSFDPGRAHLGSIHFFNELRKSLKDFEIIETTDSLNVLKRIG